MTDVFLPERPSDARQRLFDDGLRFCEAQRLDPYAAYRDLQSRGDVRWVPSFFGGSWVFTRHADCEALLRDDRFSAARTGGWVQHGQPEREDVAEFQALFARALLFVDAPDHGRLRQLTQLGFNASALSNLRPWVESCCDALMDDLEARQRAHPDKPVDLIRHLARLLPAHAIARLLGLPPGDEWAVLGWSERIAAFLGEAAPTAEATRNAQRGVLAMGAYFEREIQRRQSDPGPGLLGRLVEAHASGEVRSDAELMSQCTMLLFAGHETTRHLLGNAIWLLLSHPEQWQALCDEPGLALHAAREVLRHECPVQYTGRRVTQDLTWAGVPMKRGDGVIALIGAANRDDRRHDAPERFDIRRKGRSSLAFGSGPHVCIGASMTLMEADVLLRRCVARWPGLRLAQEQANWLASPLYRGQRSLAVWVPV